MSYHDLRFPITRFLLAEIPPGVEWDVVAKFVVADLLILQKGVYLNIEKGNCSIYSFPSHVFFLFISVFQMAYHLNA
jgi:hypothetical protein